MPYISKKDLGELLYYCNFTRFSTGNDAETEMIKEKTRLYRNTWIIPILENILNKEIKGDKY